jgi:hypothetical protein
MKKTYAYRIFSALSLVSIALCSFNLKKDRVLGIQKVIINPVLIDSVNFTANWSAGWSQYNSYVNVENDSVRVELILKRNSGNNINWNQISFIGTIAPIYIPRFEQSINFKEPNREWSLKVKTDGKFYIRLIKGIAPFSNPIILPIKIEYKK